METRIGADVQWTTPEGIVWPAKIVRIGTGGARGRWNWAPWDR